MNTEGWRVRWLDKPSDFFVLRPAQTVAGPLPGLDEPQEMRVCPVCGELIRVADPDYCGKCEAEVEVQ